MTNEPLASLLRPQTLADIVGQDEAKNAIVSYLQHGRLPSLLFRGPPGTGKTTMASVIAQELRADFHHLSGVTSKKQELLNIIKYTQPDQTTIIFLDEIHRWNKAQQDTLLPYVESGQITLIGATTENPSFTVNNALLSRCKVLLFSSHSASAIVSFLASKKQLIHQRYPAITYDQAILTLIAQSSNGDLRQACNILEHACISKQTGTLTTEDVAQALGRPLYHDADGEEHYNIISAIHKSLRDSDGDAACYRIQRMLTGGENPLYIARRLLRFAAEDIGPADNNALLLANVVYDACHKVGMPECDLFLFQLAIYLAKAPKNNVLYRIAKATKKDVQRYGNLPVPLHLRNAPTKLMQDIGYSHCYQYAYDHPNATVNQQHFPDELVGRRYSS